MIDYGAESAICHYFRIFEEFRGITQILEATAAKRMKIDP